ncbi:MAG: hypothetical protein MUF62_11785 [Chitinophagaceae bacterium]|nr:hypothetical protein [Chitinophagaceae bacterium]
MRKYWIGMMLAAAMLAGCKNESKAPDVSHLQAEVKLVRFDTAFFSLDTTRLEAGLDALQQRYPHFLADYLFKIIGIGDPSAPQTGDAIRSFLSSYQPVYKAAEEVVQAHGANWQLQMAQTLRYLQHYFPQWKPEKPFELLTFIGPMDAYEPFATGDYGDVRTAKGVGVALQLHLGASEPLYEDGRQAGIFYDYQTRRFTPDMVVVNAAKNILQDLFPYRDESLSLVETMVEKGKRLYALKKVMPDTPDSLLLGYSGQQLKGCLANEALIWNFFVKNDLLFSKEPAINRNYLMDGPKTQELGEGAPGYIGLFTGWRLVTAYMQQHPELSLTQLMQVPPRQLFEQAGYKP